MVQILGSALNSTSSTDIIKSWGVVIRGIPEESSLYAG